MKKTIIAILVLVLIAACVGQTATTATKELGTTDLTDIGSELTGFGEDVEELSVPEVDLTVP